MRKAETIKNACLEVNEGKEIIIGLAIKTYYTYIVRSVMRLSSYNSDSNYISRAQYPWKQHPSYCDYSQKQCAIKTSKTFRLKMNVSTKLFTRYFYCYSFIVPLFQTLYKGYYASQTFHVWAITRITLRSRGFCSN